jgi:hypothetical protein
MQTTKEGVPTDNHGDNAMGAAIAKETMLRRACIASNALERATTRASVVSHV